MHRITEENLRPDLNNDEDDLEAVPLMVDNNVDDNATVGDGQPQQVVESSITFKVGDDVVDVVRRDFDSFCLTENVLERLSAGKAIMEFQSTLDFAKTAVTVEELREAGNKFASFVKDLERTAEILPSRDEALARKASQTARELSSRFVTYSQKDRLSVLDGFGANLAKLAAKLGPDEHFKLVNTLLYQNRKHYGINVSYENVDFQVVPSSGYLPAWLSGPETIGNSSGRMFLGWFFKLKSMINVFSKKEDAPRTQILKNMTGVLKSGRMTLILGEGGSGKTSFMNALSDRLKKSKKQSVGGTVFYNDVNMEEISVPNVALVVSQLDKHIATLTVKETLQFASDTRRMSLENLKKEFYGEVDSPNDPQLESQEFKNGFVDAVMQLLGLTRAADTIIGNQVLKGISGGEKRRVTLGEMYAAGARVWFLDEISTGLDSAATFDITKMLRAGTRVFNTTVLVSLLQPPPESYELFDDLILIAEGRIVYQGPREDAISYFESLGFKKPDYIDVADFLLDLISISGTKQYISEGNEQTAPSTAMDFESRYKESSYFKDQQAAVQASREALEMKNDPTFLSAREYMINANEYRHSTLELTKMVLFRQGMVLLRNKPFIIAILMQNLIMGLLIGMLCFQLPFNQYYIKTALLFQALLFFGFASTPLIPNIFEQRSVYYKQAKSKFYPAISYALADFCVFFPLHFAQAIILGCLIYFMVGFSLDGASHFFLFEYLLLSYGVYTGSVVRFLCYTMPTTNQAMGLYVMFIMLTVTFSGAVITRALIPGWYIWIYWLSPLTWVYTGLLQNEFYSGTYENAPATVNGECVMFCGSSDCSAYGPPPTVTCGQYFLSARQIPTDKSFMYIALGYIWGGVLVFMILSVLALKYVRYDVKSTSDSNAMQSSRHFMKVQAESARKKTNTQEVVQAVDLEASAGEKRNSTKGLDFQSMTLAFRDIHYYVDVVTDHAVDDVEGGLRGGNRKKNVETLELLKGVDGYAKPYEMTALMGSSGAGKTTLMDVLAGRKTVGRITGEIYTNGRPKDDAEFARVIGYVEQFGVHLQRATVQESVEFSAALRLPENDPLQMTIAVKHALELLELDSIAHHLVGNDDTGLSFEEIKRLTIAVELVANPAIIFADEPTSGLESRAAMIVMRCLKNVAQSGRTVVCTIHQPSVAIFNMFDNLLLMRRGGEVVYFDKLGTQSSKLIEYFESYHGIESCPKDLNPATWMLTVIGAGVGQSTNSWNFAEEYRNSAMHARALQELDEMMPILWENDVDGVDADHKKPKKVKCLRDRKTQLYLVARRNFIEYWRTPSYSFYRILIVSLTALVIGLAFVQHRGQLSTSADVQSLVSSINLIVNVLGNYNVATIIPFLFTRKALYYRESAAKMYLPTVFAVANNFVEDPYIFAEVVISVVIYYFLVGYVTNPIWTFFYFIMLTWFFTMALTYIGMLYAALMPNAASAQVLGMLTAQLLSLFSGIIVLPSQIPAYLIWVYYISPQRWVQEGVIMTQFEFMLDPICFPTGDAVESAGGTCPPGYTLTANSSAPTTCCPLGSAAMTARDYAQGPLYLGGQNGYSFGWRWYDVAYLLGIMMIARVLGIIIQAKVNHNKR